MAIRNFWVEADVDGYKTTLKVDPRSKSDGMEVTLYQRDNGRITTAVKIDCFVDFEGKLVTEVRNNNGDVILKHKTER